MTHDICVASEEKAGSGHFRHLHVLTDGRRRCLEEGYFEYGFMSDGPLPDVHCISN